MTLPIVVACLPTEGTIERSYQIACYGSVVAAIFALALLAVDCYRRQLGWLPLYAGLVAMHPGWTMWASFRDGFLGVKSDCGYSDRFVSVAIVVVLAGMLLLRLARPDFSRRLFVLVLALACWQLWFANTIPWYWPLRPHPNAILAAIFSSEAMVAMIMSSGRLLQYAVILSAVAAASFALTSLSARRNAV